MRRNLAVGLACVALFAAACSDDGGGNGSTTGTDTTDTGSPAGDLTLRSPAFGDGGAIPAEFACADYGGDDVSPPLEWSGGSPMAIGYALIMEDPDANDFVHWVLFDIPGDTTSLDTDDDGGGTVGTNQLGTQRYLGPCPPSGTHDYVFTLYSLFEPLDLGPEATAEDVRNAAEGAPSTQLTGTFTAAGGATDADGS